MSTTSSPQFRLTNWLLLSINLVLLGINVIWLIASNSEMREPLAARASTAAAHFGMDVGYVNGPLTLLLDKAFPQNDAFKLFDESQQMLILGDNVKADTHSPATRKAIVALGTDFEISCYYSVENAIHVRELKITRGNETLFDFNADGFPDMRAQEPAKHLPGQLAPIQIWYKGQWQDVSREVAQGKLKKSLSDGTPAEFNLTTGRWQSSGDADSE